MMNDENKPLIYDVRIVLESEENLFLITWLETERKKQKTFTRNLNDPVKEMLPHWEKRKNQLVVGQALFYFLDGDDRYFTQALDRAFKERRKLQLNLRTCKEIADWPFELLANEGEFLLLKKVFLVRQVSDRGCESKVVQGNRPLRILFMAADPIIGGIESGLEYVKEEEAIFKITTGLPVQLEIEDSGSLKGLQKRLVNKYYDIVHLSGHGNIDEKNHPFFYMEDDTGVGYRTYPKMLFNEALIENRPRLLFMSDCSSSQMSGTSSPVLVISFVLRMVEGFEIPAVLGWGRPVDDIQANLAGEIVYGELSRGRTLLEAVQRARLKMHEEFLNQDEPAWPLLRLFCDGTKHLPMVKEGQPSKPNPRQMTYDYLDNSNIKLLKEGFIGRRRQIQFSLKALGEDDDKVGLLLLGAGGLGKSCLAGKICERFPGHKVIAVQGKLDEISLGTALKDAFIASQDRTGQRIL
ncbi:MAG: CHAT domain-containing protein, partial [Acidobacteria bacterium]|nr:CHAT domain-containing protein [Acidobacteriota bacterium]